VRADARSDPNSSHSSGCRAFSPPRRSLSRPPAGGGRAARPALADVLSRDPRPSRRRSARCACCHHLHVQVRAVGEYALADTLGARGSSSPRPPRVLTDAACRPDGGCREGLDAADHRHRGRERALAAGRSDDGPGNVCLGAPRRERGSASSRTATVWATAATGWNVSRRRSSTRHRRGRCSGSRAARDASCGCRFRWSSPRRLMPRVAVPRGALRSRVAPAIRVEPTDGSVYAGAVTFADVVLVALVSDSGQELDATVSVPAAPPRASASPPAARAAAAGPKERNLDRRD